MKINIDYCLHLQVYTSFKTPDGTMETVYEAAWLLKDFNEVNVVGADYVCVDHESEAN